MADEKDSALQALERTVEGLESQMREQIARTRAGATTMLVFGIVVVVCVGIVFFKFGGEMKEAMKPESVVQSIHGFMGDRAQMEEMIDQVKQEVKGNMPQYVTQLRLRTMDQLPAARRNIEAAVAAKVDEFCVAFDKNVDEMFTALLEEQREKLGPFVEVAAAEGPQKHLPLENALREAMDDFVGPMLDETMREFDRELAVVETHLDRLSEEPLGPDEQWERETVERFLIWLDDLFAGVEGAASPDA
jgi:hypothetical protein